MHELHFKSVKAGRYFSTNRSEAELQIQTKSSFAFEHNSSGGGEARSYTSTSTYTNPRLDNLSNSGLDLFNSNSNSNSNSSSNSSDSNGSSHSGVGASSKSLNPKAPVAWSSAVKKHSELRDSEGDILALAPGVQIPVNSFWNLGTKPAVKDKDANKSLVQDGACLGDSFPANSSLASSNQANGSQKKFGKGKKVTVITWG